MYVYLIHFTRPISPDSPCRHYVGFCKDLAARIQQHERGNGARLLEVAGERGIAWRVARVWRGSRRDERAIKDRHNTPRYCPLCNPNPPALGLPELSPAEIQDALIPF